MARRKIYPVLFFCLLLMLIVSACASAPQSTANPTTVSQVQKNASIDMKPILRDFLASLPADWHLVTSQDVAKTAPFIVDVRQPEDYNRGFIAGAVNIPLRELTKNLQALPAMDKEIVVVCDTGRNVPFCVHRLRNALGQFLRATANGFSLPFLTKAR